MIDTVLAAEDQGQNHLLPALSALYREQAMPIRGYVEDHAAFDPEAIRIMSRVFEEVCSTLQIADTEKKLLASEGDREFLLKELKRLQVEKADLERQFNDLSALRTQVAKLKEELSIARRLEWIRMGIYGIQEKKGAERLMAGNPPPARGSNYNLNVELKQDGGAVIVPRQTNANSAPR